MRRLFLHRERGYAWSVGRLFAWRAALLVAERVHDE